jgi:hypothetical protein
MYSSCDTINLNGVTTTIMFMSIESTPRIFYVRRVLYAKLRLSYCLLAQETRLRYITDKRESTFKLCKTNQCFFMFSRCYVCGGNSGISCRDTSMEKVSTLVKYILCF